ncbi:MAG: hypothetical protein ACK5O8_10125 [Pirellula sp.]
MAFEDYRFLAIDLQASFHKHSSKHHLIDRFQQAWPKFQMQAVRTINNNPRQLFNIYFFIQLISPLRFSNFPKLKRK